MNSLEKEITIKRYSQRLLQHGSSPLTLGWTKGKHCLRYYILTSQWQLMPDDLLLDFGCGFGDLYDYLSKSDQVCQYRGFDLNPELLAIGKEKYPGICLSTEDIFTTGQHKSFDYAVSSGVHNAKLENNWQFIENTFERFSYLCRKSFAINFISDKVNFRDENLYYTNPVRVLELAYSYSKKIILRNDYMPFEFTIIVDLRDQFDTATTTYTDFYSHLV